MKILIGGDYVPLGSIEVMMNEDDYSYFDDIKSLCENSDLSIINLEAPIVKSKSHPIEKCGPNLKISPKVINSLKYAGVDMVTLANNHIMDYGDTGLEDTLSELDTAKIKHIGAGKNLEEAQKVEYVKIDGKILAIVNCCEHEFSIATESKPGANPLNPVSQFYAISEARKKSDFVLVIVHGGHELWQLPSPRMVETYRFFIDAGADAVINHHQHCYSGYEIYKNKPIFYGIGNLCFPSLGSDNPLWNYGYLVMLFFGETISFNIIPYSQCCNDPKVTLLSKDLFDKKIARLNAIIENPNELKKVTKQYYDTCCISVNAMFEPYRGLFTKLHYLGLLPTFIKGSKRQMIKNYIMCEAHRDKVINCI